MFIEDIRAYGEIYRAQMPSFDSSTAFAFGNGVQRLFHILDVLQITTFHPFILFVFKEYAGGDGLRERLLADLEKFVMRRVLSRQETKSFNKRCRDFLTKTDSLPTAMSETSDEQVLAGLKGIRIRTPRLLCSGLSFIEGAWTRNTIRKS